MMMLMRAKANTIVKGGDCTTGCVSWGSIGHGQPVRGRHCNDTAMSKAFQPGMPATLLCHDPGTRWHGRTRVQGEARVY